MRCVEGPRFLIGSDADAEADRECGVVAPIQRNAARERAGNNRIQSKPAAQVFGPSPMHTWVNHQTIDANGDAQKEFRLRCAGIRVHAKASTEVECSSEFGFVRPSPRNRLIAADAVVRVGHGHQLSASAVCDRKDCLIRWRSVHGYQLIGGGDDSLSLEAGEEASRGTQNRDVLVEDGIVDGIGGWCFAVKSTDAGKCARNCRFSITAQVEILKEGGAGLLNHTSIFST